MPKYTLTIEADSLADLFMFLPNPATDKVLGTTGTQFPAGAQFPDIDGGADPADLPAPKKARSHKAKSPEAPPPASATKDAFQAAVDATDPGNSQLPPLESLKHVITTAVRLAQKGEGDLRVLQLLPEFKKKTGLDFVMNAQDQHRAALYDLVRDSGLSLG